mmetsp:Transcript_19578/g.37016  ORF Transcript_19578/g.37016 Transcript_19578/m.37016 type:complete len:110 (-) Transcript_19578:59-388(-)
MGKAYFEFLEDEFQALTSQLQKALSTAAATTTTGGDTGTTTTENKDAKHLLDTQFTRCQAILQQLHAEAAKDKAFQDRWELYKIQLHALQEHHYTPKEDGRREVTYRLS